MNGRRYMHTSGGNEAKTAEPNILQKRKKLLADRKRSKKTWLHKISRVKNEFQMPELPELYPSI
jgi:hypothetical protein